MNWLDLIILIILGIYLYYGARGGFLKNTLELLGFGLSFFLALKFYPFLSPLLLRYFSLPLSFAKVLGFFFLWVGLELIFYLIFRVLYPKIETKIQKSYLEKYLGPFPSLLKGMIILAIVLTLIVGLPTPSYLKTDILKSRLGGLIVKETSALEVKLKDIFGQAVTDTLTFLTIKPESQERIELLFKKPTLEVDEASEMEMLRLVNRERTKRGLHPLKLDLRIRQVARAHSKDMFENNYFSHISLGGLSPFDRLAKGGVKFTAAGENLAYAPNVELAHQGLMGSPGHRRNILDPTFRKIGIGVIEGGIYGKMFTQNFTD